MLQKTSPTEIKLDKVALAVFTRYSSIEKKVILDCVRSASIHFSETLSRICNLDLPK